MPRGDKAKYPRKQKRKAEPVAESYEKRGVPNKETQNGPVATSLTCASAAVGAAPVPWSRPCPGAGRAAARQP